MSAFRWDCWDEESIAGAKSTADEENVVNDEIHKFIDVAPVSCCLSFLLRHNIYAWSRSNNNRLS